MRTACAGETDATSWCSCAPDPNDMTMMMGIWDCTPVPIIGVVAVFDRLLDTAPLRYRLPDGSGTAVTASAARARRSSRVISDYASTGTPTGFCAAARLLLLRELPRPTGRQPVHPARFPRSRPARPSRCRSQSTMVRAKDGTTPFTGEGLPDGRHHRFHDAARSRRPSCRRTIANPTATSRSLHELGRARRRCRTSRSRPTAVDITGHGRVAVNVATRRRDTDGLLARRRHLTITMDGTTKNVLGQPLERARDGAFTTMCR